MTGCLEPSYAEWVNIQTLKLLAKVRDLSQSDLALAAGVSRQAVSLWFRQFEETKNPRVNIFSKNLEKLSLSLKISVAALLEDLPDLAADTTDLLWDFLYPDIESFVCAVIKNEPAALARLVQVYGVFGAKHIAGNSIVKNFESFKLKIHPSQRKKAEIICNLIKKNQAIA